MLRGSAVVVLQETAKSFTPGPEGPLRRRPLPASITVAFKPGEHFLYSNYAYGVPELLIESVSKEDFAEFMERRVFIPLGMKHSSAVLTAEIARTAARKYDEDGQQIPHIQFVPAGGAGAY